MKNTIKTIAALLIIGMSFTACTKEEVQPSPISFPYPPSHHDFRDAAEGTFQWDSPFNLAFVFVKDLDSVGKMLVLDYESNEVTAVMFIIMETRDGFTYGFENDSAVGRYDKNEDTHTITDGREFLLLRVN